jgi:hypothetical protein
MNDLSKQIFDLATDINRIYMRGIEQGKNLAKQQTEVSEELQAEKDFILTRVDNVYRLIDTLSENDSTILAKTDLTSIGDFIKRRVL